MSKLFYPSYSSGQGRVYLEFELLGAGSSALTLGRDASPMVAGVSRSGTGVFVVTLKDPWVGLIAGGADVDDTLNDGAYATVGTVTNEGNGSPLVFTLRFRAAAGTLADPAAARKIGVRLAMRNTKGWGAGP